MKIQYEAQRLFIEDESGKMMAEVTFPVAEGVATIDHTFVDDSLRGQGIAGKLMQATADYLKEAGLKVHPVCSYAVSWFEKHGEYRDMVV